MRRAATAAACSVALALAGCASTPAPSQRPPAPAAAPPAAGKAPAAAAEAPPMPAAGSGQGGYYQDDGPGENPPPGLRDVPDAEPRIEAPLKRANKPYVVFGKTYTPIQNDDPFTQKGVASWYGKKFHGQRTSSGELYDMYKMTGAHPTLPIPSYVRVTSAVSGKQVVVRINDRGPFHSSRIIDVSYTAALKLGLLGAGSHEVQIERLLPADIERLALERARENKPAALAAKPEILALMLEDRMPADPAAAPSDATPEAASESAPVALTSGSGSFYLQLGAFARVENAEAMRASLVKLADPLKGLDVSRTGVVFRLFSGPFPSRADAMRAMKALPAELHLKPIIMQR